MVKWLDMPERDRFQLITQHNGARFASIGITSTST